MTSVRDLLDIAAAELDTLSCRLSLGEPVRPEHIAAGWTLILPAAQHLIRQTAGPYSKVHQRHLRALDAVRTPSTDDPDHACAPMVRTARALGAAGDLLLGAVHHDAGQERAAMLGEAARLLTACAEVTLHGIGTSFEHSATLVSAAMAGGVARALQPMAVGPSTTSTLMELEAPAPALPRAHPLGPLAEALHEWTPLATRTVDRAAPSSHDLRGVTLVSGQLVGAVRALLAAGPPDATSPPDDALDRLGRAWANAGRQWDRFVLPGSADRALATSSWQLVTTLGQAFSSAAGPSTALAVTPAAATALRRSVLSSLLQVSHAHSRFVSRATDREDVAVHVDSLPPTVRRLVPSRVRWQPAPPREMHTLVVAYSQLDGVTRALRGATAATSSGRLKTDPPGQAVGDGLLRRSSAASRARLRR